jgi:hypothetical protein
VSKANRRFYRTTLLGIAAMASLVWVAVDQFGISWEEMLELFLGTLMIVGVVIAVAGLMVGAWLGIRKLLQRDSREP